jgi:hypothetical protein
MKRIVLGLALLAGPCAAPAHAQGAACLPLTELIATAAKQYGELPVFQGADAVGSVLLILVSQSGSFTAVRVLGETACILTVGEGATVRLPKAPERAS